LKYIDFFVTLQELFKIKKLGTRKSIRSIKEGNNVIASVTEWSEAIS
jgi:hypothetical protein